jgi:hypothetical protein
MAEIVTSRPKDSFIRRFWESSKPPPGEEGVLGAFDTYNRASYRITKPAAIVTGVATLVAPEVLPVFLIAGGLAVGDKLQIKGSQEARQRLNRKGAAKYSEHMTVRNNQAVEQNEHTYKIQPAGTIVEFTKK